MPGQFRYSVDHSCGEILARLQDAGVKNVMFFGIPDHKDEVRKRRLRMRTVSSRRHFGQARSSFRMLYLHRAMCACASTPPTATAACFAADDVDNDKTLELSGAKSALSQVQAGADMVAPSDMMDGRVRGHP